MNFKKKLWLGSSILALMSHGPIAMAIDSNITWQARQLEEVLEEIVVTEENELSYTVKYGDTLSVISEAMNIESRYLAEINNIEDVDLIFPETVLTAQYDANDRASNLTVDAPNGDTLEVSIPVNLSDIPEVEEVAPEAMPEAETETEVVEEVIVPEETVSETETESSAGGAAPSNTIIEEVPAWVEEEPAVEAPVEEALVETEVVEEAPVVEEAAYTEAPATEVPAETAPVYEEPVYEEVPVEEAPVEEPVYEEPTYETDLTVDENGQAWEPVEETPVVEEEPAYVEPEAPVYEEPVYEEPVYEEPVYEEPAIDPTANPENAGLQPHAAAYKEEVAAIYGIDSFSLYRPGDTQDHGAGLAVDFMVPVGSQVGDDIANYSINSMAENDISYVIWEQQIYGDWNQQWTAMEDRGSITANHYDHVHVSFNPAY
ncbi:LysM peptidoglycan-binding domain-containing protein [Ruoffia tabacinasalis]|uniref:LysM peptidoglycan-binding domain-containing protein n=1 Tax=Ruoffia tabacinasalis TaxID=87458 RepID=A0A5R9DU95_9LACT|nr:LysM domain-containing protein [Ruoffia tabacinasalis]TLQ40898.1 LysM peptidoglycan-binding domain-containing protein [Ruoffia tabacinasalis]